MMEFSIHVTKRNIEEGIPKSPSRCPIALACMDEGLENPLVMSRGLRYRDANDKSVMVSTGDAWNHIVLAFDMGHQVHPQSFTIKIPRPDYPEDLDNDIVLMPKRGDDSADES